VLPVLRAEPAVERAAALDVGRDPERSLARLVEFRLLDVSPRIGVDQALEPAVVGAPLPQEDLTVTQEHLPVDRHSADRADRAGDLVEDLAFGASHRRTRWDDR